jgi:hypothetical protein
MDGEKGGDHDPKEEENYERASYLLARRQWNLSYPINAGLLIFGALAAAGVVLQSVYVSQTLTETRNEFKAAQRAYVNLGAKTGIVAEFDTSTVEGKPIIALHFTNGGQSTARHLSIQVFTSKDTKFSFAHRHRFSGSLGIVTQGGANESDLAAQSERTEYISDARRLWSLDELKETDPTKSLFLIQGEIAYCDIFGVYHCQPFAVQFIPAINKFGPWAALLPCYVEPGHEQAWYQGGQPVIYKEIEPCEQPNEPEYYEASPPPLIATPTATP